MCLQTTTQTTLTTQTTQTTTSYHYTIPKFFWGRIKIEHRGKMQFLAFNIKTKAFKANLTRGKIVYQVKIYLP